MYKILAICLLATLSSACGFHLKGGQTLTQSAIPQYKHLNIEFAPEHQVLCTPLLNQLKASGIRVQNNGVETPVLKILDYQFRRQQLNGKLTEVLLHINVTFRIEDATGKAITEERIVRSHRNYQYNIATVNTENQQESFLKQKMLEDIAQQISMQITHQRLPQRQ